MNGWASWRGQCRLALCLLHQDHRCLIKGYFRWVPILANINLGIYGIVQRGLFWHRQMCYRLRCERRLGLFIVHGVVLYDFDVNAWWLLRRWNLLLLVDTALLRRSSMHRCIDPFFMEGLVDCISFCWFLVVESFHALLVLFLTLIDCANMADKGGLELVL